MATAVRPAPLSSSASATLRRLRGDFAYWASTCYTIRDKADKLRPLHLRAAQQRVRDAEAAQLAAHGRARLVLLKGRQGGFTTAEQAKSLHTIWRNPGARCLTLAHEREATDKIFEITHTALEHFPSALMPRLGEKATREVSFPGLGSFFYTGTAGAKRSGRGLTLTRLHGSEFFFWDAPRKTLNAVAPALERPGTSIVLESTASAHGSEGHAFWLAAEQGRSSYVPLFFPWWVCDPVLYRLPLLEPDELGTLDEEERALVSQQGLDREQLKWRRQKMRDMGRDEFLQEYAEDAASCWLSVGGLVYEAAQLKRLMGRVVEPTRTEQNGALKLWYDPARPHTKPAGRVIVGADTAEGVGGDRSTFVARTLDGKLLATYADSRVDPIAFAGVLHTWGRTFADAGGPAFLVVEKNAHGITVLRTLRDVHGYPSSRLYHRAAQDKATKERNDRLGWHTSAESKPLLLDAGRALLNAADQGHVDVPSAEALTDAFGVRRDETGHVSLNGRDTLVAEALCWIGRTSIPSVPDLKPLHY